MNDFWIWFSTGFQHILDWNGYDHILYVISLCVLFTAKDWKKLLVLVTAFTIGHSLTLAMSVLDVLVVKQSYIELLIPLTIMSTCIVNIFSRKKIDATRNIGNFKINYSLALVFGFIHGMGFSYLLKSMLGEEENTLFPLLSFNLGLEFGQIIIVVLMLLVSVFLARFTRIKKADVILVISSAVLLVSTLLFIQRLNAL
ncbi:MAG: HupE / UreJ protein [Sphingobacteriaceae bacterium]|nr:HupE / UreJ protein [Sphingobacteriaceae bacterium]